MRLNNNNLLKYVEDTYGPITFCAESRISGYTPLLQDNYGKDNDCTLTCITSILSEGQPQGTYEKVEAIALKYGYNGDGSGTNPFAIKTILDKASGTRSKRGYGKGIGYTWKKIKSLIAEDKPIILSLNNDGRDCYVNHSVVIAGVKEFDNKYKFLRVYDNWYLTPGYIDYKKLSMISSINYLSF